MIDQEYLQKIEGAINSRPCDACGKQHHLKLRQNSAQSSANSSTVGVMFPTGDKVMAEFSSDSCEDFKARVEAFILTKTASLVRLPFDVI